MEKAKGFDKSRWEVCVHEASHFVFARLMKKLNIDFPQPTKIIINPDPGWTKGTIDGGYVQGNNTNLATNQLNELAKKPLICKISQIMFLLAGYASFKAIIDSTQDLYPLEDVILPVPPCPSDIDQCQKIAGKIVGNTIVDKDRSGRWKINKASIDFLTPIRNSVIKILSHQDVKDAIKYAAESLNEQGEMSGQRLKGLDCMIDAILLEFDIEEEVQKHLAP